MLKLYTMAQKQLAVLGRKVKADESGASLIEYSILIGLITALVIASVVFVGGWVESAWALLESTLAANQPGGT